MDDVIIDTKAVQFLIEEKGQFDFLKSIADSPEKTILLERIVKPFVMRGISVDDALHLTRDIVAYSQGKTFNELNLDTLMGMAIQYVYDPEEAEKAVIDILNFMHEYNI